MKDQYNTVKTLQPSFATAYESFHPVVRREIKAKIVAFTGWSRITFYNKKNKVHRLSKPEFGIVELVFLDYGVSAWTGEEITETVEININN